MALPISSKITEETTRQKLFSLGAKSDSQQGGQTIVPPLVTAGDRLAQGMVPLNTTPNRTEAAPSSEDYQAYIQEEAAAQGVTRDRLDQVEQGGAASRGAAGQRSRYLGPADDGSNLLAPAPNRLMDSEAERVTPLIGEDALLDVTALHLKTEIDNPGYLSRSRTAKAVDKISSLTNYLIDESNIDPEFEAVADKLLNDSKRDSNGELGKVSVGVLGHVAAYTMAGALNSQNSFVAGKRESQEASRETLADIGVPMEERSSSSQIGMDEEQLVLTMANRARQHYESLNPNHDLSSRDFQVMGLKFLQKLQEDGELVTTKINNQAVLLPTGADNIGSVLGAASDLMVGADRQQGNSVVSNIAGAGVTKFATLPQNRISKKYNGTETPAAMVTMNIMGRVPRGMGLDESKTRTYQLMDVVSKMVFPDQNATPIYSERNMLNPKMHLMYSASAFASTFKMDLPTAEAAWRSKIFQVGRSTKGSSEANPRQQNEQISVINSINNTRLNNYISSLSKQVQLIVEGGFHKPNNAFFPNLSIADINGRINNSAHDGNITGGKALERQMQTFKAKAITTVPTGRAAHLVHSKKITAAANKLFANEGNNIKFQSVLDSMDSDVIHEIAFRCNMVGQMLDEGNSANKKNARGVVLTKAETDALTFLQNTQMAGVGNITYSALHQVYLESNESDPIGLESYFGQQGAEIASALDTMSPRIEDLTVPNFELNESSKERTQKLMEAWGTIEIPNDTALQEHASGRGDTQAKMSVRKDALKYMEAYKGDGPNNFFWEYLISIDAKQSGPMIQSIISPGPHGLYTQNVLGGLPNSTLGDLRDYAENLMLNKDTVSQVFKNDKVVIDSWHGFLRDALQGKKANTTREILLKQPITQYFFGKPSNMFGDSAAELLGYFEDEIRANDYLDSLSSEEIVEQLSMVIEETLNNKQFDGTFSAAMKSLGLYLAMTDSDLVMNGPFGPINISAESLEYVFKSKDLSAYKKGLPDQLEPDVIQMMVKSYDENNNLVQTPLRHYVRTKQRTAQSTKGRFRQDQLVSGDNLQNGVGKKLGDSLSVLITHQIESGILNYTINKVNVGKTPQNIVPIASVYDNVLTNGEGYFRYGHTYNNEAMDMVAKWDVYEALQEMVDKANKKFLKQRKKDWKGRPTKSGDIADHYNISVMQGSDGQTHRVERYSPLTSWLDNYFLNMPNKYEYPNTNELKTKVAAYISSSRMKDAVTDAGGSGYKAPIVNEFYLENGYLPTDQALIENAAERANMFINRHSFDKLMTHFTTLTQSNFKGLALNNKANKNKIAREGSKKTMGHLQF